MKLKLIDPRIFRKSFNNPPEMFERKPSVVTHICEVLVSF